MTFKIGDRVVNLRYWSNPIFVVTGFDGVQYSVTNGVETSWSLPKELVHEVIYNSPLYKALK